MTDNKIAEAVAKSYNNDDIAGTASIALMQSENVIPKEAYIPPEKG